MKSTSLGQDRPIPVFILSYNRIAWLRTVVASYLRQNVPLEIIVHDNGSDEQDAVKGLRELEASGVRVFRYKKIQSPDELGRINRTVNAYFGMVGYRCDYIVTDSDIDLGMASPDAVAAYRYLLDLFPHVHCVGPMLTIADVKRSYPLFNRMINCHVEEFWQKEPQWVETPFGRIAYIIAPFDTTFAMHRGSERFRRGKLGLRLYTPFEARHLDWYKTREEMLRQSEPLSKDISHWGNRSYLDSFKDEKLLFTQYNAVEYDGENKLEVVIKKIPDDHPE